MSKNFICACKKLHLSNDVLDKDACNVKKQTSCRPAIFFDRDGVLNKDAGHTHRVEDLVWIDGAKDTIKFFNDIGYYVFVVTNQSGIAKGLYVEEQMHAFHHKMQSELQAIDAHIDEFAFCPHHPEGVVKEFAISCYCRKPQPKMIDDLLSKYCIIKEKSLLIGDRESDMLAASNAGIKSFLFAGGNLRHFIDEIFCKQG